MNKKSKDKAFIRKIQTVSIGGARPQHTCLPMCQCGTKLKGLALHNDGKIQPIHVDEPFPFEKPEALS